MSNSTETGGGGLTFCGLLTCLFIALKLIDKISWKWVWVLSPMWIPLALMFTIILIAAVIALIRK